MKNYEPNGNKAFNFAKQWYQNSPDKPIPHEIWLDQVNSISPGENPARKYDVSYSRLFVSMPMARMIPVLAGVSAGLTTPQLCSVAANHGVTLQDLDELTFGILVHAEEQSTEHPLTTWGVTSAVIRAFCHDPDRAESFFENSSGRQISPTQELAFLTAPQPEIWPVTGIESHLRCAHSEQPFQSNLRPTTHIDVFAEAEIDIEKLKIEQFLALLKRSGNLVAGATSEYGFSNTFFRDMFMNVQFDHTRNLPTILKTLNGITSTDDCEQLRQRILESLSDTPFKPYFSDGEVILSSVAQHLSSPAYRNLADDIVLKLNLIDVTGLDDFKKITKRGIPACYAEFFDAGDQLLKKVNTYLMDMEVSEFRRPHFLALKTVTVDWDKPQDLSGVDLHALFAHCLEAFEAYQNEPHVDLQGKAQQKNKDEASASMTGLCRYVMKHVPIDPSDFPDLSSASKRVLAGAGIDIKKLPGMNNRDRGHVLSDQLGI